MTSRGWLVGFATISSAVLIASYSFGLDRSPVYLAHDEVVYALNAQSIATTGRDLNGQWLPVSIPVVGTFFATPFNIYMTALFLKVLPLSEVSVRLPSVVVGLLCVALTYVAARSFFRRPSLAAFAAGLLALSPAHFIHSRLGTDHLYFVLLVVAWFCCLTTWGRGPGVARFTVGAMCLGLAVYSYIGALVAIPVLVAMTLAAMWHSGHRSWRAYAMVCAGLIVPALPFVWWHLTHPAQYLQQLQMYGLYHPRAAGVMSRPGAGIGEALARRVSVYWDYFNPSFLFFAGDAELVNGTRAAGVFLLPMLLLIPIGVLDVLQRRRDRVGRLALAAFVLAPLPAVLVAEPYKVNRALVMLPFGALLGAAGFARLWSHRLLAFRMLAAATAVVAVAQFGYFYRDYLVDYPLRSARWFESNIKGGVEGVIGLSETNPPGVLLDRRINWIDYYWPFYLAVHGRTDLRPLATFVDISEFPMADARPGTLVMCRASSAASLVSMGFSEIVRVTDADGYHAFSVLRR